MTFSRGFLLVWAAVLACACGASKPPATVEVATMLLGMESPVVTQSFRLPNGLGVVLSPGTGETGAAIRLRYYAGRKDDPPGRAGLAHIVEHLMFHGTPNGGSGSFYQNMERVGPDVNANVGDDATDYFEQVPRSAVERALWLEADRMAHAVVRFDERGLQIEREAVRNELRERSTTYPEHAAHRLAASLVFGAGHPYGGHDGDAKTLDAISLEELPMTARGRTMRWRSRCHRCSAPGRSPRSAT